MISPFALPPHPWAQKAAQELIARVHQYMCTHPESELHRRGKMFGVLVYDDPAAPDTHPFLAAFSAQLDGSYHHDGFVPPVYDMPSPPIGKSKADSQRLQRLLFANYHFLNAQGETQNALEIFASVPPILSPEDWFHTQSQIPNLQSQISNPKSQIPNLQSPISNLQSQISNPPSPLPPSGAGDCCAPKLLQYAFTHHLTPIALAEFWVGAPSQTEIRHEGTFYPPCSGRCVPILRHMLKGLSIPPPNLQSSISNLQSAICNLQSSILYSDPFLIVVNKPSGLLSVPGKTDAPSVVSYLAHTLHLTYLQAAHRLDQDTSGLLVLAKTPEAYKTLQSYFQRRDILKRYRALLYAPNGLPNDSGCINLPLLPNPYDRPRQMVDHQHGKIAITRYQVLEKRPNGTVLIDFFPLTGRTHQLRVHAAHPQGLNAPILGDRLYGPNFQSPISNFQSPISNFQSPISNHLCLCAIEITFPHPIHGQTLHFSLPQPSYFTP